MKIRCILLFSMFIQLLHSNEYNLNERTMHVNARDLALGSIVCEYECPTTKIFELTYLMPFQLKDLSIRKLAVQAESFSLNWSAGWIQSGNMDWMENTVMFHVGKALNDRLYLGINCNIHSNENTTDDGAVALLTELSSHFALSQQLSIGFHLMNPFGMHIQFGREKVTLTSAAFLGTRFSPTKTCSIYGELACPLSGQYSAKAGMEYFLDKAFVIRMGCQSAPTMPSWGIGGSIKQIQYSWGGNLHPILGISNGFTLSYCW